MSNRFQAIGLQLLCALLLCGWGRVPARAQQPGGSLTETTADVPATASATSSLSLSDTVTAVLVSHGFANVATVLEGGQVVVTFENTRYRDLARGLREIAELLLPLLRQCGELVLVPSVDGVPLGTVRYSTVNAASTLTDLGTAGHRAAPESRTSISLADIPPSLASAPQVSSSYRRVDVVVHPWFDASFGDFDEPVRSRTGVAPEIRVAVRRGLRLSAQVLFTLQDDLPTGESRVRPGLVTLSQTLRLPRNVFVHAAAGAFTANRYGANVQVRTYSPSSRWFAGAELGQTGVAFYARDDWRFSRIGDRTALVEAGWRDLRHGLTVQATAGAFLADQQGIRIDIVRQFGEVDLGGFVVTSAEGKNGGAVLRIPLGVSKHPKPRALRLRAADAFRWEYRYYGYVPGARRFRTGYPLDEVTRWIVAPVLPAAGER